jgi:hypothetical protein
MRNRQCIEPGRRCAGRFKNRDVDVLLKELEAKYGISSRITATIADYAEEEKRLLLYHEALRQAKAEGDTENEQLILDSLAEIRSEKKTCF